MAELYNKGTLHRILDLPEPSAMPEMRKPESKHNHPRDAANRSHESRKKHSRHHRFRSHSLSPPPTRSSHSQRRDRSPSRGNLGKGRENPPTSSRGDEGRADGTRRQRKENHHAQEKPRVDEVLDSGQDDDMWGEATRGAQEAIRVLHSASPSASNSSTDLSFAHKKLGNDSESEDGRYHIASQKTKRRNHRKVAQQSFSPEPGELVVTYVDESDDSNAASEGLIVSTVIQEKLVLSRTNAVPSRPILSSPASAMRVSLGSPPVQGPMVSLGGPETARNAELTEDTDSMEVQVPNGEAQFQALPSIRGISKTERNHAFWSGKSGIASPGGGGRENLEIEK